MGLFKKLVLYKRLLVFFIVLNVFSILLSSILGINFFTSKRSTNNKFLTKTEQINTIQKLEEKTQSLYDTDNNKKITEFHIWSLLNTNKKLQDRIIEKSSGFVKSKELTNFELFFKDGKNLDKNQISFLAQFLVTERKALFKELQDIHTDYTNHSHVLILTGLGTLIFGLILPLLIITLLTKLINETRLRLEKKALNWFDEFLKEKTAMGDGAFKSPEFWLKVFILSVEYIAPYSNHPIANYGSHISKLVRIELGKVEESKDENVA